MFFHASYCSCDLCRCQRAEYNQKCAENYELTLITLGFFSEFFSQRVKFFFFFFSPSNPSEAVRSWNLRNICTYCCNLEHFLLCSTLKPFSEAADEGFQVLLCRFSFSWKHLAALALLSCAPQLVRVCVSNQRQLGFSIAALSTHVGEPWCPGRVGLRAGFTSLLMKQGGTFSGLQSLFMLSI